MREVFSAASFSEDRRFRYWLLREWQVLLPKVAFIGLNPSTADETVNDPTVTRCINYAKAWGKGGLLMLNAYAYRATEPKDMWKAEKRGVDILGGDRNHVHSLREYTERFNCDLIVAAWGNHGKKRGPFIVRNWPGLMCLATNSDGSPKHPLYLKGDLIPRSIEA